MRRTSRRSFLAMSAALPVAAAVAEPPKAARDMVAADLKRYIDLGSKQAGGDGDNACGAWLQAEVERLGFAVERQALSVPFFEPCRCELVCGDARAASWPQPIVMTTGSDGVSGRLVRVDAAGRSDAPLAGAIALIDLPYGRWSTAVAKPVQRPVLAAFAAGAVAAVILTNGPTRKIIALNADGRKPMFPGPVALLAPADADAFFAASMRGERATLYQTGRGGHRPAFNFIARLDRGRKRWLAISTPRSGWYGCAGERGGGIAAWLWLARWASAAVNDYNLAFVCNTGHEYEYLGADQSIEAIAPKPSETFFWLHLGANLASRDWHDATGTMFLLPGVDSQRYLAVSPSLLPAARSAFAGQPGLEAPYSRDVLSAGELDSITAAGYASAAGVFGLHRFHHVADDDERCVSASQVAVTAAAFQKMVETIIAA